MTTDNHNPTPESKKRKQHPDDDESTWKDTAFTILYWVAGVAVVCLALYIGGAYLVDRLLPTLSPDKVEIQRLKEELADKKAQPPPPPSLPEKPADLSKEPSALEVRLAQLEKAHAEAEAKIRDRDKALEDERADRRKQEADAAAAEKLKADAAAEAKKLAEEEEAKKVRLAEVDRKDEEETQKIHVNHQKEQVFDYSKNFEPKGHQQLEDVDAVKASWAGWKTYNGWHFPLVTNKSGNPGPIKGDVPPQFISPGTTEKDWSYQTIVIQNPNGSGQYTTKAWATKKRPKSRDDG